jgi:cell division protein FtsI (penicillin-binding protein 3)
VTDTYEPGSTFKIVTAAAVLDAGTVHPEQRFDCGKGAARLDGRMIRDSSPHGVLSFREIVEVSSNVGMVHVVRTLDRKRLHDSIVSFGFSEPTGIDLPGEQGGKLRAVADWSNYSPGSLAFGHEIAVTPLQMATAFATVANGGRMASPRIVLGTRDEDGRLEPSPGVEPRRVVTERTALTLAGMLEGVVVRGTGTRAAVHGYRLAGKTGTAQKWIDGEYSETHYVASFGGFAPVSEPRLAGLVVLDEPRGTVHTGGGTAAPAFGRIMAEALTYLRVPPDDSPVLSLRMPPGADASATPRPRVARAASDGQVDKRIARAAGKSPAETTTRIDR